MRRYGCRWSMVAFVVAATVCGWARPAPAQPAPKPAARQPTPPEPTPPGSEPTPPGAEPAPPGAEPTPPGAEPTPPGTEPAPPGQPRAAAAPAGSGKLGSISWQDIVTVPRRPILKYHRVELLPQFNLSINSNVIRHYGFGGEINFFLSETFWLGIEGTYYQQQQLEHYFLIGYNDRVLPSVNRYRFSGFLNFGYVPIYGKFAIFNRWIFQWEAWVQGGVGVFESEWIPRDPADLGTTNYLVAGHIDLGTRVFISKWLALNVFLKDYLFADKYEPANRMGHQVPSNSDSRFVQNLVFGVGLGLFLPTGFEYKYLR